MFKETVYHGTIQQKADAIVKEGFIESSKDIEWLGTGIYFFAKREDAELWAENEAAKKKNKVTKPCLLQANIFCNDAVSSNKNIGEVKKVSIGGSRNEKQ